jgi:hypothetical protein
MFLPEVLNSSANGKGGNMSRLDQLAAMNPEFAEALARGEKWALKHADAVNGLDGKATRRHPERAFKEDGVTRKNWCGSCASKLGCMVCDLDGDHMVSKGAVGIYDD